MSGLKQSCPECGKSVTNITNKQANFRQGKKKSKTDKPTHRHVSTTFTYACDCGKIFTRIVPVKKPCAGREL